MDTLTALITAWGEGDHTERRTEKRRRGRED
jgi:hypothetical protein